MKKALLIVDVQNDFCTGGALAVPFAEEIIPYINEISTANAYDEIILTRDWHPADHRSFAENNGRQVGETIDLNGIQQFMWPVHCVAGTPGADYHPDLNTSVATHEILKGQNRDIDSYSAFQDNNQFMKTGLETYLKSKNIEMVEVVGLALDYCVKYTCIDAAQAGFITCLHFNGTRAVNVRPENGKDAIMELLANGVSVLA